LTDSERKALDAHLDLCDACRLLLEVGREFDSFEAPELDDGERIERLSRAARAWSKSRRSVHRSPRRRRVLRWRVVALLAAGLALVGGVAAAALGTRRLLWPTAVSAFRAPPASPPSALGSRSVVSPVSARPRAEPEPRPSGIATEPDALEPSVPDPVAAPVARSRPTRRSAPAIAPSSVETAASIFRVANESRRDGDARGAIALYRKLQRLYPASPEANLSSVALGGLLLDDGQARAALDQFDRAAGAPGGTLRPEALYGRARALAAMKAGEAERIAWSQLLQEFPTCPYAETARRRLAAGP
jgi:TolA-binding protein